MDVSRLALVARFLVGLLTPSNAEATHQNLYQAIMAPPTHPTGSQAYNSCGWHTGSHGPVSAGPLSPCLTPAAESAA